MKKSLLFAATALAMLASCSQNDDLAQAPALDKQGQTAVTFGTYMGRTPITRATVGKTGDITETNEALKANNGGFGVFATYTKNLDYDASGATKLPNFMYNQGVTWDATNNKWTYSPVKYWPNGLNDQAGAVGGDDNTLTAGGKVSFFAYAPYVATAGGSGDDGIIGFSANDANTHPTVTYKMPATNMVDLLWGTATTVTANQSGNDLAGNKQAGKTLTGGQGPVNVDLTKQQLDGKVRFLFKHALAKVGGSANDGVAGGLQIMLDIDALSGGTAEDDNTIVTVEEIKINTDYNHDGDLTNDAIPFASKGTLDLATGVWTLSEDAADKVTINQVINTAGTAPASALNTEIAEPATVANWAALPVGVKIAPKNVYATGQENSPLLFIPGATPKLQFTITYIVRTQDTKLAAGYSEVKQTVSKTITFGEAVKMNKKYNIIIHLGLTSVKFEATVADWSADIDDDEDVDDNDKIVVNLPLNVE